VPPNKVPYFKRAKELTQHINPAALAPAAAVSEAMSGRP
jgi:hypothetical protein